MGIIRQVVGYFDQGASSAASDGKSLSEIKVDGETHLLMAVTVDSAPNVDFQIRLQGRYTPDGDWHYLASQATGGDEFHRIALTSGTTDGYITITAGSPVIASPTPSPLSGGGDAFPWEFEPYPVWGFHSIRAVLQVDSTASSSGGSGFAALTAGVGLGITPLLSRNPWGG